MLVNICGISTLEAAQVAADEGVDLIGFVVAPSTRRIEPSKAKEIVNNLPNSLKTVGVFVNETKTNIEKIAQEVGLDYIQLHGDETAEFARELSLPVDRKSVV